MSSNERSHTAYFYRELNSIQILVAEKSIGVNEECQLIEKATISNDTKDKINRLAKGNQQAEYMIYFSVFSLMLYKYYTHHELVVLTDFQAESSSVNRDTQLPVILRLDDQASIGDNIKQVSNQVVESSIHHGYSEELLLKLSDPSNKIVKKLSQFGFFFNKRNDFYSIARGFMVSLFLEKEDKGLKVTLIGSNQYLDQLSIQDIAQNYILLLDHLDSNLKNALCNLPFYHSKCETHSLSILDRTSSGFSEPETIISVFERICKDQPHAIAVSFLDEQLTYGKLSGEIDKFSNYLVNNMATPPKNRLIGVSMEPSVSMIICILGIMKSGNAYVPINPKDPEDRIRFIVDDLNLCFVVTDQSMEIVSGINKKIDIISWRHYMEDPNSQELLKNSIELCSKDVAYCIFTSGTSGYPKAVPIKHEQVINLIQNENNPFAFSNQDHWILFHSFNFDFSVWEIFGALLNGASLFILPENSRMEPEKFFLEIICRNITILNQVPGVFNRLFMALKNKYLMASSTLRYIIFGGDKLNPLMLKEWRQSGNNAKLINMYGITETTVHVTYKEITDEEILKGKSNIGIVLPGYKLFLMNENGKIVPTGIIGEIVVGGIGVSMGYLNRTHLNNSKFCIDPENPGQNLYFSGDLARQLPNGDLEFLGRKDNQVKLRGYRIELGEIQNKLNQYNGIKDSLVLLFDDNYADQYLVAYVLSDQLLDTSQVREYLTSCLPGYMIPSTIIKLNSFPLSKNGKIERALLPDPVNQNEELERNYVAPHSTLEKKLVRIWEEFLGQKPIGVESNFFTVGGDSIKAIRVIVAINKIINSKIEVKDLFKHQEIRSLAKFITQQRFKYNSRKKSKGQIQVEELKRSILDNPKLSACLPIGWQDFYPMSNIELGMVFYAMLNEKLGVYHDQFYFQFKDSNFNYLEFINSFKLIIRKHEILRTSLNVIDFDQPLHIVHEFNEESLDFFCYDISGMPRDQQIKNMEDFLEEDRKNPFNITQTPLWRMRIFLLGNHEIGVFFIFHHAILDGWSYALMLTELSNVYFESKKNPNYSISPLSASYRDFVIDQISLSSSEGIRNWWKEYLLGYHRTQLPLLKSLHFDNKKGKTARKTFEIPRELVQKLKVRAKTNNVSLKNLFLAAFAYLLRITTGQNDDLTFGIVANARPEIEDGDKILGCFINAVPFRCKVEREIAASQLLREINNTATSIKKYDKISLLSIKEIIGELSTRANPIYDILFNYIDFHIYQQVHENVKSSDPLVGGIENTNTEFDFTVNIQGERIIICMNCKRELYSTDEFEILEQSFLNILKQIGSDVNLMHVHIPEIQADEREKDQSSLQKVDFKVVSTCVMEPIAEFIEEWIAYAGMKTNIEFAPYNQMFQFLYNLDNLKIVGLPICLIGIRFEDFLRYREKDSDTSCIEHLDSIYEELVTLITDRAKSSNFNFWVTLLPTEESQKYTDTVVQHLSFLTKKWIEFNKSQGHYIINFNDIIKLYKVDRIIDQASDSIAHMPYTREFYAAAGIWIVRNLVGMTASPYKLILLDCDNVLWKGICGEVNDLAELSISEPYQYLQQLIVRKFNQGFLVGLISKNNEKDVWNVFNHHPDMQLKKEHIISHKINWENKSKNVAAIAHELGINYQNIIVIDDSAFECEEIDSAFDDILCVQIPVEEDHIKYTLDHLWALDRFGVTREDELRNQRYKDEKLRENIKKEAKTLDGFLKSINITINLQKLEKKHLERVMQLNIRTNQFNLNGIRRSRQYFNNLLDQRHALAWVCEVSDRFGDYGLVGCIIGELFEQKLRINTMMLSCRILGRNVEYVLFRKLIENCRKYKILSIDFEFVSTDKNLPFRRFLSSVLPDFNNERQHNYQLTLDENSDWDIQNIYTLVDNGLN